jgi:hypothetical protein
MSKLPGAYVFDTTLIDTVAQRQRLVLTHSARRVERSALIIEFDSAGGPDSAAQLFERVREQLIQRFGKPTTTYEEGDFGPDYASDVNRGRLVRVMEWHTPAGVVRFGIPRRMDGRVRMELQHARSLGSPRTTRWSIEAVR